MSHRHKPPADLNPTRGASLSAEAKPMGLLYTLLRHGRGLSHEEALRRSWEPVPTPPEIAA